MQYPKPKERETLEAAKVMLALLIISGISLVVGFVIWAFQVLTRFFEIFGSGTVGAF
jgi:hypothetical protein